MSAKTTGTVKDTTSPSELETIDTQVVLSSILPFISSGVLVPCHQAVGVV